MTICALVVVSATAGAAPPSVGVVVTGDDTVQTSAEHVVGDWLGKHDFAIAKTPLDPDGAITLANCLAMADMACARGVIEKRSSADSVVVIVAQASGKKAQRDLQLSAYWITKNRDVVSLQRTCNHCKDDVLPKTLEDLMSDLSRLVPAATGKVEVASKPPGLIVMIDNDTVGITPVSHDAMSGPHEITVSRDGKVIEKKSVTVVAGQTAHLDVVAPPEPPKMMVVHHSKLVPSIVLGVGIAGIATGIVMYEKGGPSGKSMYYTDYKTPGPYVAAAGGALAITGAALLLFRSGTTEVPVVAATRGGALIGWSGRF